MIKNLLLSACMAGAISFAAGAQQVNLQSMASLAKPVSLQQEKNAISVKHLNGRVLESKQLAKGLKLQKVQTADGIVVKRLVGTDVANNKINPKAVAGASLKGETGDAITLNESFEDWDGEDNGWLPEGWSKESKEQLESDYITDWFISYNASGFLPAFDGLYAAMINFDTDYKDEWLISPVVDLPEYPNLYYKAYVSPLFLFDLNYLDFETFEFTEYHMAANLQILVRAEGDADWTVVKDYYEEYAPLQLSYMDLAYMEPTELQNEQIDLSSFKGKRIQVAFRYYGTDGNSVVVDAVRVSNPAIEASYSWPLGTLFYGIDPNYSAFSLSLPVEPVNVPLTWYNTTEEYTASFSWSYQNAETEDVTSNERDLTETYHPDYTSDFTSRNNCYLAPTLTATAPGAAPGEFKSYDYFQCGGKAEWMIQGEISNFGLSVFNANTEGLDISVVDNDMESSIPIFGYSPYVDQYWTDYTFQGDEGDGDGVKLTGIINYYFTQEAPIVISGAWVHAKGLISDNAEFTLDIIPVDDETGEMTSPIASAKVKGSDLIFEEGGTKNFYTLPFSFETPVVLSQMDCFSYVVRLSGFNDPENVEWFAPYQSVNDNPDGYALGWIEKAITYNGETRTSLSPIANYTGYQSFSIVLDAAYPWLDSETTEVAISASGEATVALGSYYDGSEFTITLADGKALPEWLSVAAEGRYGEAKVAFTAIGSTAAACDVKIAAPGVAKVFHVNYDGTSAVDGINADGGTTITEAFDAMGRRVDVDSDAKGIFMLRLSDGCIKKIIR